jgi:hypothetical protein
MIMYVCDLCKASTLMDEIVFVDVMKGRDRYQFELCERCYRRLFKDVKKRKADLEALMEVEEDEEDT